MASGLEKLAASDEAAAGGTVKCSWDLSPQDDSRVGFLLARSSAPLTGAYMAQPEAGTRGRNKPFPSPARKGQGQTEAAQALASLGWLRCALTGWQCRPSCLQALPFQAWQGEGGTRQRWGSAAPPNRKARSSLASTGGPSPKMPTLSQGANSKAEGYPGEQFWQQEGMEK